MSADAVGGSEAEGATGVEGSGVMSADAVGGSAARAEGAGAASGVEGSGVMSADAVGGSEAEGATGVEGSGVMSADAAGGSVVGAGAATGVDGSGVMSADAVGRCSCASSSNVLGMGLAVAAGESAAVVVSGCLATSDSGTDLTLSVMVGQLTADCWCCSCSSRSTAYRIERSPSEMPENLSAAAGPLSDAKTMATLRALFCGSNRCTRRTAPQVAKKPRTCSSDSCTHERCVNEDGCRHAAPKHEYTHREADILDQDAPSRLVLGEYERHGCSDSCGCGS